MENPKGILKRSDLIVQQENFLELENLGHAVVLAHYGKNFIEFHNSWGDEFGIQGSFRIEDSNVLNNMKFIDVYWYESDLTEGEREVYYKNH